MGCHGGPIPTERLYARLPILNDFITTPSILKQSDYVVREGVGIQRIDQQRRLASGWISFQVPKDAKLKSLTYRIGLLTTIALTADLPQK